MRTTVPTMKRRFRQYRHIGGATFPRHQRGLDLLGLLSIVMLLGVSVSGVWQFFVHEPDPNWFGYVPNSTFTGSANEPTVAAQIHDLCATGCGIIALLGTAWLAYRITHRVPAASVAALAIVAFGALLGSLVRYNVIKVQGQSFDEIGPGYLQLFTGGFEYVATDTAQLGPAVFRFLVVSHIATVPVLVLLGWRSILRALDRRTREITTAPERTWFTAGTRD